MNEIATTTAPSAQMFLHIMGVLITLGLGGTLWLFRKGGVYNPPEDMPSTDNITVVPLNAPTLDNSLETHNPAAMPINPLPTSILSQKQVKLEDICTYMRDFEGKPGDANYRNNNPLNCKFYYGGYLPKYEPVKISPNGFAIFKNYDTGWRYGVAMIRNKIKNHPNWTLYDMISDHAPASDNNPVLKYTQNVAKRAGVDIDYPCKLLV